MHKPDCKISIIESWYGDTVYKPSDALNNSDLMLLKAISRFPQSKFEQFQIRDCLYFLLSSNFKTSFKFINKSMVSNYITWIFERYNFKSAIWTCKIVYCYFLQLRIATFAEEWGTSQLSSKVSSFWTLFWM